MKRFEGLLPAFQMTNDENQTEFLDTAPIFYRFNAWFEEVSEMFANIISARHSDDGAEPAKEAYFLTPEHDDDVVAAQSEDEHPSEETAGTEATETIEHQSEPMPEPPAEFPILEAGFWRSVLPVANVAEPVENLADADPEPVEPTPVTGAETQVKPVVAPPGQPTEITPTTGDEFLGIPIIYVEDLPPAEIEEDEDQPAFLDCMF